MFDLNEVEKSRAEEFKKIHKKCYRPTAIGGQFSYIFTPTSVGTAVSIKCICGEQENITDYDIW